MVRECLIIRYVRYINCKLQVCIATNWVTYILSHLCCIWDKTVLTEARGSSKFLAFKFYRQQLEVMEMFDSYLNVYLISNQSETDLAINLLGYKSECLFIKNTMWFVLLFFFLFFFTVNNPQTAFFDKVPGETFFKCF